MAGLEDMLRKAASGGNMSKPLIACSYGPIGLGRSISKRRCAQLPRPHNRSPTPHEGAGGILGGLGGLLDKLQKGGLG